MYYTEYIQTEEQQKKKHKKMGGLVTGLHLMCREDKLYIGSDLVSSY